MAVSTSLVNEYLFQSQPGTWLRRVRLTISGLPANANTAVAHGLVDAAGKPIAPIEVGLEPKSNSFFFEYQNADNQFIYVGVGAASGSHAVDAYLTY